MRPYVSSVEKASQAWWSEAVSTRSPLCSVSVHMPELRSFGYPRLTRDSYAFSIHDQGPARRALLQQSDPGRGVRVVALSQASSRLDVKLFTKNCDGFCERTDTDAEGAFHNARFAADIVGEVKYGRLLLA